MSITPANADLAARDPEQARLIEQSLDSVREALAGLRYGHVGLTVHEGRVVQIDVTEKRRFNNH
ncbi:hypothetical protein J2792_000517 [Novosphingobium capsulatum]|uniref:DUF2292 domain-containing protein n=1 Tax=Novosphingobium capsulatum TaxID=13688 RepID=A0ABU1MIC5_9SPHN|nr:MULTISPECIES: YezD family protein [Novosphingobium]MBB3357825.1 hypothetical protein [Novosphingobium sp. BK256]MBB3373511.1 hypothetical protein [Novosphingobium sp. BK280]MBB3377923.1 hypothetical protein [Novosphingobium sp. BK258]MBB3420292.1 hypothetical protein [Novosphingobium sp. BK267]MBB3447386.1 hypothetical protein [Novosphingobium sp. BK352]